MNRPQTHHHTRSQLTWFSICILALLSMSYVFAQTEFEIGSIIRGFEMPQHDENGVLKLKVIGREATVMTMNRIKVRGLKIELYDNDETIMEVTSKQSDFWRIENRLTTSHGVNIKRAGLNVEAENMDWNLTENRGHLQGKVKVTLTQEPQDKEPTTK
ncbi:MAG: hypothetical protein AAF984_02340 [Verrucomicrobiota bacterium]